MFIFMIYKIHNRVENWHQICFFQTRVNNFVSYSKIPAVLYEEGRRCFDRSRRWPTEGSSEFSPQQALHKAYCVSPDPVGAANGAELSFVAATSPRVSGRSFLGTTLADMPLWPPIDASGEKFLFARAVVSMLGFRARLMRPASRWSSELSVEIVSIGGGYFV